jgi:hypothetical protein
MNASPSSQAANNMTNYHAYLIRLWREDEGSPWRGELVSPHTGEQLLFATVEQVLAYLTARLQNSAAGEEQDYMLFEQRTEHD